MIRRFLLWLLHDDIISIADARANRIIEVNYAPRFKPDTYEPSEFISAVWIEKNGRRIILNDVSVYEKQNGEWVPQTQD